MSIGNPASFVDLYQPTESPTACETIATTRWGQYTTEVVKDVITSGCELAGTPGAALEVGCEGGRWSQLLSKLGWTMTCTDVDSEMLSLCQRRLPSATCVLASQYAETLPSPDRSVRLLLCAEVSAVIERDWFPAEASRVLADDGVLIGSMLNRTSARGLFVRIKQYRQGGIEIYNRTYDRSYGEWRRAMRAAGFEMVIERGCWWFPFGRGSNSQLIPLFVKLERRLGLDRLAVLSPWVAFVARKKRRL